MLRPRNQSEDHNTVMASNHTRLVVLAGLCILGLSVVFNEFGFMHFEWWSEYVTFHLGPGSLWTKILNSYVLDSGLYLGREFSYLVDHIDMRLMALSVRFGFPVFDSFVHLALSLFIGVRIARYASRDLQLGSLIGLLLALIFWTAPSTYLHFLMRTAKGLTATGLIIVLLETHRLLVNRPVAQTGCPWRTILLITAGAAVMSFSDRQGLYFLLTIMIGIGIHWLLVRSKAALVVLGALTAVLAAELLAFFWITPALIRKYWHYEPDFSYNRMPWAELWPDIGRYVIDAGGLLFDTMGNVLGGLPAWLVLPLVPLLIVQVAKSDLRSKNWRGGLPASAAMIFMLCALWAMYGLLLLRHPPLLWPDIRVVYYWIPTSVLVVLGLAWAARAVRSAPSSRTMVPVILGVIVAGNVMNLPRHKQVLASGHLRESIETSRAMREALMEPLLPDQAAPENLDRINAFRTLRGLTDLRSGDPAVVTPEQYLARSDGHQSFLRAYGGNLDPRFLLTTGQLWEQGEKPPLIGTSVEAAVLQTRISTNRIRVQMHLRRLPGRDGTQESAEFAAYALMNDTEEGRLLRWRGSLDLAPDQEEVIRELEIDGSGLPTLFTVRVSDASSGHVVAGWRNPMVTHVTRDTDRPLWIMPNQHHASVEMIEADYTRLLPANWRPMAGWMRGARHEDDGIVLQPGGEIWLRCAGDIVEIQGESWREDGYEEVSAGVTGWWFKGGRLEPYELPSIQGSRPGTRLFRAWGAEYGGWLVITAPADTASVPLVLRITHVTGR